MTEAEFEAVRQRNRERYAVNVDQDESPEPDTPEAQSAPQSNAARVRNRRDPHTDEDAEHGDPLRPW